MKAQYTVYKDVISKLKHSLPSTYGKLSIGSWEDVQMDEDSDYMIIPIFGIDRVPLEPILDVAETHDTYVQSSVGQLNGEMALLMEFLWIHPDDTTIVPRKRKKNRTLSASGRGPMSYSTMFIIVLMVILAVVFKQNVLDLFTALKK